MPPASRSICARSDGRRSAGAANGDRRSSSSIPRRGRCSASPRRISTRCRPGSAACIPPDLVLAYNDWFGRYVHGWWNSQLTKRDVHLPARDEVFGMLVGRRASCGSSITRRPARPIDSMTGFTYTDSRTGAMTYYTSSGGQFNSRRRRTVGRRESDRPPSPAHPDPADPLQRLRAEHVGGSARLG